MAERVLRLRALIALVVLGIVFSVLSPEFLTSGNLSILVKHVAINAILAIGMTFVILSGGIDLRRRHCRLARHGRRLPAEQSHPAIGGCDDSFHAWCVGRQRFWPALLGLMNGSLVARFRVAPSSLRSACCCRAWPGHADG
jgi:erythritol transport system permease protein